MLPPLADGSLWTLAVRVVPGSLYLSPAKPLGRRSMEGQARLGGRHIRPWLGVTVWPLTDLPSSSQVLSSR